MTQTALKTQDIPYRDRPGLNYSTLARFYQGPDFALLDVEPKSYFEIGNSLELALQDRAQGTDTWHDRFFEAESAGTIPEKLVKWIEDDEDLTTKYTFNKDGETRNKKYSRIHDWLDECIAHPGKIPMGKTEQDMVGRMLRSILAMEIEGVPFTDVLPDCMFQVPLYWESRGIQKKALLDIVYQTEDLTYIWDLKSAANFSMFKRMLRQKYWIQYIHYTEGAARYFKGVRPMNFLVASKSTEDLNHAMEVEVDRGLEMENFYDLQQEYENLTTEYLAWVDGGKKPKGYRDKETVFIYK